jgi:PAS domain S-box-containing protein
MQLLKHLPGPTSDAISEVSFGVCAIAGMAVGPRTLGRRAMTANPLQKTGGCAKASPRNPFRRVDAMPEGVVFSDRDGVIRLWNRGAEAIFGCRPEDALGQTLDLIIPERWRARHWEGYRTVMRTGVTRYGREVLAVPASRSDGAQISIEFSIMLPTGRDGQVLGAVAIVRDVTTRWQQEQMLRRRLADLKAAKRVADSPDET